MVDTTPLQGDETPRASKVDISVVIPVRNAADMVAGAVKSVRNQDPSLNVEIVAVDDGSTDDTYKQLEALDITLRHHDDSRGPGEARNTGIRAAAGEWVAFLDADDRWSPRHLATLWAARDGVDLVCSSCVTDTGSGLRVVGSHLPWTVKMEEPADLLRPENLVSTSACMVRTSTMRAVGGFPPSRYFEDLEAWIRVVQAGSGRVLPDLTVAYRTHASQLTNNEDDGAAQERLKAMSKQGLVDDKMSEAIDGTDHWDEKRSGGEGALEALREIPVARWPVVAQLLARRLSVRHRWRLDSTAATNLAAMLK